MPAPINLPPIAQERLSLVLLADSVIADGDERVAVWTAWVKARPTGGEVIVVGPTSDVPTTPDDSFRHVPAPANEPGTALRLGLDAATCPLVAHLPLGPDYSPADLDRMLALPFVDADAPEGTPPTPAIDHVHILTAYRAGVPVPGLAKFAGRLWRFFWKIVFAYPMQPLPGWLGARRHASWFLARAVFGLRVMDLTCPLRVMRREFLSKCPIQSRTAFAHVELLAKANFLGCYMGEEMPVSVVPGPYRGDAGAILADARLVFNKPTFVAPPEVAAT